MPIGAVHIEAACDDDEQPHQEVDDVEHVVKTHRLPNADRQHNSHTDTDGAAQEVWIRLTCKGCGQKQGLDNFLLIIFFHGYYSVGSTWGGGGEYQNIGISNTQICVPWTWKWPHFEGNLQL